MRPHFHLRSRLFPAVLGALLAALTGAEPGLARAPRGAEAVKVIGISDGDTVSVLRGGKPLKVRLFGVDCPELAQDYGRKARTFTGDLAFGKTVTLLVRETDRYGRTVAEVTLPDGRNLGRELVGAGLAWVYRQYSRDPALLRLEAEAREARRGLWADPAPTPPWSFRRSKEGR